MSQSQFTNLSKKQPSQRQVVGQPSIQAVKKDSSLRQMLGQPSTPLVTKTSSVCQRPIQHAPEASKKDSSLHQMAGPSLSLAPNVSSHHQGQMQQTPEAVKKGSSVRQVVGPSTSFAASLSSHLQDQIQPAAEAVMEDSSVPQIVGPSTSLSAKVSSVRQDQIQPQTDSSIGQMVEFLENSPVPAEDPNPNPTFVPAEDPEQNPTLVPAKKSQTLQKPNPNLAGVEVPVAKGRTSRQPTRLPVLQKTQGTSTSTRARSRLTSTSRGASALEQESPELETNVQEQNLRKSKKSRLPVPKIDAAVLVPEPREVVDPDPSFKELDEEVQEREVVKQDDVASVVKDEETFMTEEGQEILTNVQGQSGHKSNKSRIPVLKTEAAGMFPKRPMVADPDPLIKELEEQAAEKRKKAELDYLASVVKYYGEEEFVAQEGQEMVVGSVGHTIQELRARNTGYELPVVSLAPENEADEKENFRDLGIMDISTMDLSKASSSAIIGNTVESSAVVRIVIPQPTHQKPWFKTLLFLIICFFKTVKYLFTVFCVFSLMVTICGMFVDEGIFRTFLTQPWTYAIVPTFLRNLFMFEHAYAVMVFSSLCVHFPLYRTAPSGYWAIFLGSLACGYGLFCDFCTSLGL